MSFYSTITAYPLALVTVLAIAGCGGGNASGTSLVATNVTSTNDTAFLGVWSCSGTQIETCGGSTHADTSDFTMTIVPGASANAITTDVSNNVDVTTGTSYGPGAFPWTVAENAATLDAPLTVTTLPGSVGGTWTPTYTSASLSFSGAALVWDAAGSAVYVNGTTQICGFTQTYTCAETAKATADGGL